MAKLRVPVSDVDHAEGPKDAPLILVEYGDYQCPSCGEAFPIVKRLQKTLKNELRFVFRNFPLSEIHPHAMSAAKAAEAAALQRQFWAMHRLLFEHQQQLDDPSLLRYAEILGLNTSTFMADVGKAAVAERIASDREGGARSGVNGTPTFFVNGSRVDAGYAYETLLATLRAALPRP